MTAAIRTHPDFFAQWLAGGRSRLVSDALGRLTPADIVNIIEGLPAAGASPADSPANLDFGDTPFHRLPEIQAFAAELRAGGQSPSGRVKALRVAWETLLQKRPAEWTASDIFECLSSVAATRLVSAAQLAQAAALFWQSRRDDPQAAGHRERLIDFLEGALVLAELRQARIIR